MMLFVYVSFALTAVLCPSQESSLSFFVSWEKVIRFFCRRAFFGGLV